MLPKVKEFKAPKGETRKLWSDNTLHSAVVEDTWTSIREELWKPAYSEGCISKDMMAKGFDKEQTLAAMRVEKQEQEARLILAMEDVIALGDPTLMDASGRPTLPALGKVLDFIPSVAQRNKAFKGMNKN